MLRSGAQTEWADGNSVIDNTVVMNTCGLKGPLTGNTFAENVLFGNIADICPWGNLPRNAGGGSIP